MSTQQPQIIDISRERVEEATEVLTRAFENYPMMDFFFAHSGDKYVAHIREAFRFTCLMRLELNDNITGVEIDGRLVAVACISNPERPDWPESLQRLFAQFEENVGPAAWERFGQYGELTEKYAVAEPHFYLIAIGVDPAEQGKGYGRLLLDDVQRLSESHPTSTGVALDTETHSNLALYQHCGYQITAQSDLDGLPIWFLFRSNQV
jgi:GNAT superfamily N-acetyltransferase